MEPENGWLEDEISFGGGLFSGAMLVSGRVTPKNINMEPEKHHDLHMAFAFPEVYIYIQYILFSVSMSKLVLSLVSWLFVGFFSSLETTGTTQLHQLDTKALCLGKYLRFRYLKKLLGSLRLEPCI